MSVNNYSDDLTLTANGPDKKIKVEDNLEVHSDLSVGGDSSLTGSLAVDGALSANNTLTVSSSTTLNSSLTVSQDTNLQGSLQVSGTTILPGRLDGATTGVISLSSVVEQVVNLGGPALGSYIALNSISDASTDESSILTTNANTVSLNIPLAAFNIPDNSVLDSISVRGSAGAADCELHCSLNEAGRLHGTPTELDSNNALSADEGEFGLFLDGSNADINYSNNYYWVKIDLVPSPSEDVTKLYSVSINWKQSEIFYASKVSE